VRGLISSELLLPPPGARFQRPGSNRLSTEGPLYDCRLSFSGRLGPGVGLIPLFSKTGALLRIHGKQVDDCPGGMESAAYSWFCGDDGGFWRIFSVDRGASESLVLQDQPFGDVVAVQLSRAELQNASCQLAAKRGSRRANCSLCQSRPGPTGAPFRRFPMAVFCTGCE